MSRAARSARALRLSTAPTQVLFGLDLGVEEGGITTLLGANGAGKTTTLALALRHVPHRRRDPLRRQADRAAARPRTSCGSASRMCRRAAAPSRARPWRRTSQIGAMTRRDRAAIAADIERVYGYFPRLKERHAPAGRHALGRRAADARGRPRHDAAPAPDAARRAVVRARAADRARSCSASCARSTSNEKVSMLLVEQNAALALDLADHAYLIETGRLVMEGPAQRSARRREHPPLVSRLLTGSRWNCFCIRCWRGSRRAASMPAWRSPW